MPHPIVRALAADGPMLATLVDGLPRREGWRYEPKWDGWRCLAVVDGGRVDLRSRRATDLAAYFPELLRPPVGLAGRRAVLDGEVVVLRHGRPDFDAISGRLAARRLAAWAAHVDPSTFVAFEILELDGQVITDEPYTASRAVMGWAASTDKEPAGLVLGAAGAIGELRVVGVAPLHADRETRDVVMRMIEELRGRVPMLAPRWRRAVTWVDEGLVAEVRYLERTPLGLVRHASVQGVRHEVAVGPSGSARPLQIDSTR